jgi:hypothetical protein
MFTASIVLYNTPFSKLNNLLNSILDSGKIGQLYLIDNCPVDSYLFKINDDRIIYIKNSTNIGFGSAHNIALKLAIDNASTLHFIVNPDIHLKSNVIVDLINSMYTNEEIGLMMPNILNKDGSLQHLPKLLPSPFSLLVRKLNYIFPIFTKYIAKYELRNLPENKIVDIPIVSGCFSILRIDSIKEVGLFDERFFLYFEDWDLSRRISQRYRTVINTSVYVVHEYNSGANRNIKLFFIFLNSAIIYFRKWGFLFDSYRTKINKSTLNIVSSE